MVKDIDGSLLSNPKEVRNRWKQHFHDLLIPQTPPTINLDDYFEDRLICWKLNDPPGLEELEKAIERLF